MKHLTYKLYYTKPDYVNPLKYLIINSSFNSVNERKKMSYIALYEVFSCVSPTFNKAKKSIANFRLRKGNTVGMNVTIKNKRLLKGFLRKFIGILLPNLDFNPISIESYDKNGNVSRGFRNFKESPEFTDLYETINLNLGYNINFVFSNCTSPVENVFKLSYLKIPIRD